MMNIPVGSHIMIEIMERRWNSNTRTAWVEKLLVPRKVVASHGTSFTVELPDGGLQEIHEDAVLEVWVPKSMREHKYRVWDRDKKQMFPVSEISFGDDGSGKTIIVQPAPKPKYHRCLVDDENCVLLECTGFKDTAKDQEIYEGDILESEYGQRGIVKWEHSCFMIMKHDGTEAYILHDKWRIIGNIYEHPELLEKK